MIYLVIFVTKSTSIDSTTEAVSKIQGFCTDLIAKRVFKSTDRFVICFEDLFDIRTQPELEALNANLRNLSRRLILPDGSPAQLNFIVNTSQTLIINYIQQLQSENVLPIVPDPFFHPNIAGHLMAFRQVAQVAIAPTLIKELLQAFFLHFLTTFEDIKIIYCDLDIRHENFADLSHISPYETCQMSMPARLKARPDASFGNIDFDVFFALSFPPIENSNFTFLKVFRNILYFTVSQFGRALRLIPQGEAVQLVALIADIHSSFKSFYCDESDATETSRQTLASYEAHPKNGQVIKWLGTNLPHLRNRTIIALHCGNDHNKKLLRDKEIKIEVKNDNSPGSSLFLPANEQMTRQILLSSCFANAYVGPFRRLYAAEQYTDMDTEIYKLFDGEYTKTGHWAKMNAQNLCFWYQTGSLTQTGLRKFTNDRPPNFQKSMGLSWGLVPFLLPDEIQRIVHAHPFMAEVLTLTAALREWAKDQTFPLVSPKKGCGSQ